MSVQAGNPLSERSWHKCSVEPPAAGREPGSAMPGRYRFPRPSRRLRQTRLEPRERQRKLESHDLPVNRRPVIAGDHGCLRCCQPVWPA
jgi:hypothetical protein